MSRADEAGAGAAGWGRDCVAGGRGIAPAVWGLVLGGGGGGHGHGVGVDDRDGEVGGAGRLWAVV